MLANLRKPHVDLATLVLRVGLAVIFVWHGALKLGQGEGAKWTDLLTEDAQILVAWCELLGGIAIAFGFLTRLAALGIIVIMVGAISVVTGGEDLIQTSLTRRGYDFQHVGAEYNFVIIMMCAALILLGSGRASLDFLIGLCLQRRKVSGNAPASPPVSAGPALTPR
jgi:putative oxidoreductase